MRVESVDAGVRIWCGSKYAGLYVRRWGLLLSVPWHIFEVCWPWR